MLDVSEVIVRALCATKGRSQLSVQNRHTRTGSALCFSIHFCSFQVPSCGCWAYLETSELDPSSGVEIDHTRHPQLKRSRLSCEINETIFDKCKRKRLFIANEDEYEERPCKRRSIEQ